MHVGCAGQCLRLRAGRGRPTRLRPMVQYIARRMEVCKCRARASLRLLAMVTMMLVVVCV